jgi:hypothetical protein
MVDGPDSGMGEVMDDKTPGLLILLANLAVFGLTLKLYTEYFKDKSHGNRVANA